MSSLYRQQLEQWIRKLDIKVDKVVDVGGGQLKIPGRVNSWEVSEYLILDNDKQYNPDLFHDLNKPLSLQGGHYFEYFDALFCLEVFEYIYDPLTAHKTLGKLLKPGGVAYISYPTWYPLHNPPGIDYLRYTKNAVDKFLKESGFNKIERKPRVATEGRGSLADFYSKERMRPIRTDPAVFDTGYLVKAYKGRRGE